MAEIHPASPEVCPVRIKDTPYWWPLTAVMGWSLSRDPAVVAALCEATDAAKKASILLLAAHGRWAAVEAAQRELRNALSADKMTAWGDPGDGSGLQCIGAVDWADLNFCIEDGLDRAVSIGAFSPEGHVGVYHRVRIACDDVLRLWPAVDPVEPNQEAGGRPGGYMAADGGSIPETNRLTQDGATAEAALTAQLPSDGAPPTDDSSAQDDNPYQPRRGRAPKYDWEAFHIELTAIANRSPDGLPLLQADAERMMLQWCRDKWGEEPSESMIRTRVGKVYDRLQKGR